MIIAILLARYFQPWMSIKSEKQPSLAGMTFLRLHWLTIS